MSVARLSKIKSLLKEKIESNSMRPQFWKPLGLITRVTPSRPIQNWLKTPSSLTAKLKDLCPNLEVVVLSEKWEVPMVNEAQQLGLEIDQEVWVRCVFLKCHDRFWIYARTVIPDLSPNNPWQELQNLGNKPLGEILFDMPSVKRSAFEFSKDSLAIWPHLMDNLQDKTLAQKPGFARRSSFKQKGAPLLLTEVFLPSLLE
jgi:chorismate--pyruvate lyase